MPTNDTTRIARQLVETSALLGVDFVPVANNAPPTAEPAASDQPTPTPAAPPTADDIDTRRKALDELRTRYENEAQVPKLIEGWNKIVFGDGSPAARLVFVGEAPGADEDAQGIPFVGRAGKLLADMIKAMGLSRTDDCYITNILKVRPPNNRTPTVEEAALDGPYLLEQLRIIRPAAIVTLGKPAAHFLLKRSDAMGALRGHWFDFDSIPLMPTYHPAYLLRAYTPENRKKVWSDLQQVMTHLGLNPSN